MMTPRNLPCGHTFCEGCLYKMLSEANKITCPICRNSVSQVIPNKLPKNYIAYDIAVKAREDREKCDACPKHPNEPVRLYCNTCKQGICAECIINHSGHHFVKKEESSEVLHGQLHDIQASLTGKLEEVKEMYSEKMLQQTFINDQANIEVKNIEEQFDYLLSELQERSNTMNKVHQTQIANETEKITYVLSKISTDENNL